VQRDKAENRKQQILEWLFDRQGVKNSQRIAAHELGISQQMISKYLRQLFTEGRAKIVPRIGYQYAGNLNQTKTED